MPGKSKKKQVLKGHKRKGSRFIPPMLQLPGDGLNEVSYVNQILPQCLWIAMLNDAIGYRKSTELVLAVCNAAFNLKTVDRHVNFALVSNFELLTPEQKSDLVDRLAERDALKAVREILAPLISCYKDFPLKFLGMPEAPTNRPELVERLKAVVEKQLDRYSTPAMAAQATAVYIRIASGGLSLPEKMSPPNLNALISDPESDEGRRAGGFVRATIMIEFMPTEGICMDTWPNSFWNTNLGLDDCQFSGDS